MSYAPIYNELVEKATTRPLEYRYSELWEALLRAEKYIVKMEKMAEATRPEEVLPNPAKALAAKLNEIDAARYRWLNKKYDVLLKVGENDDDYTKRHVALKCGPELDRWIDARLAEETPSPQLISTEKKNG